MLLFTPEDLRIYLPALASEQPDVVAECINRLLAGVSVAFSLDAKWQPLKTADDFWNLARGQTIQSVVYSAWL